jgi:prepilin-type N-terminal cleavage/methylation domain-containing protein
MSRTGSERGFSLLEVLVATVILSIGVVFLFPSFFMAADALVNTRERLTVQSWAENRLWESARTLEQVGGGVVLSDAGEVLLGKKTYAWEMESGEVDPGLSSLSLTVRWTSGGRMQEAAYVAWVATAG